MIGPHPPLVDNFYVTRHRLGIVSTPVVFARDISKTVRTGALIRVYDDPGNVIETHEQRRVSKTDGCLNLLFWRIDRDFRHTRGRSLTLCPGRMTSAAYCREHCQQKQQNFDSHSRRFTTQS